MMIAIIAALGKNGVIGYKNQLPWRLPADLKHFKSLTLGKPVIMGRNTFLSIGKPLPKRHNIVLTQDKHWHVSGISIVYSIQEAIDVAEDVPETMVIGGERIYQQTLPIAQRLYLTIIQQTFTGDVFFPDYNQQEWIIVDSQLHLADEKNPYSYEFQVLERRSS